MHCKHCLRHPPLWPSVDHRSSCAATLSGRCAFCQHLLKSGLLFASATTDLPICFAFLLSLSAGVPQSEQRSAYLPSTYARSTLDAVREGPQQVSNLTGRQIMRRASDEEEEIRQARRKERKSEESAGSYFGP